MGISFSLFNEKEREGAELIDIPMRDEKAGKQPEGRAVFGTSLISSLIKVKEKVLGIFRFISKEIAENLRKNVYLHHSL